MARRLLLKKETPLKLRSLVFSPMGPVLAAGTATNNLVLWDLRSGKSHTLTNPNVDENSDVTALAFSPDDRGLASTGEDHSLMFWE